MTFGSFVCVFWNKGHLQTIDSIIEAWSEQKSIALLKYYFQSQSSSTHPWFPSSRQNVYHSRLVLIIAIHIWGGLWLLCMCVLQQRSPTNYRLNFLGMIRVEIYSFDEIWFSVTNTFDISLDSLVNQEIHIILTTSLNYKN